MAKLVDLKRSKKERKDNSTPKHIGEDDYPYGLTVHLDHDTLTKLGVHTLPKAGSKVKLQAHAHVKSTEDRTEDGGKRRRSMSLELRHMAIEGGGAGRQSDPRAGAKAAMDEALAEHDPDDDGD